MCQIILKIFKSYFIFIRKVRSTERRSERGRETDRKIFHPLKLLQLLHNIIFINFLSIPDIEEFHNFAPKHFLLKRKKLRGRIIEERQKKRGVLLAHSRNIVTRLSTWEAMAFLFITSCILYLVEGSVCDYKEKWKHTLIKGKRVRAGVKER